MEYMGWSKDLWVGVHSADRRRRRMVKENEKETGGDGKKRKKRSKRKQKEGEGEMPIWQPDRSLGRSALSDCRTQNTAFSGIWDSAKKNKKHQQSIMSQITMNEYRLLCECDSFWSEIGKYNLFTCFALYRFSSHLDTSLRTLILLVISLHILKLYFAMSSVFFCRPTVHFASTADFCFSLFFLHSLFLCLCLFSTVTLVLFIYLLSF